MAIVAKGNLFRNVDYSSVTCYLCIQTTYI